MNNTMIDHCIDIAVNAHKGQTDLHKEALNEFKKTWLRIIRGRFWRPPYCVSII